MPATVEVPFDPRFQRFLQMATSHSQIEPTERIQFDAAHGAGPKGTVHLVYSSATGVSPHVRQLEQGIGKAEMDLTEIRMPCGEVQTKADAYTGETMTSPSREEIALQFQNARLQVDKDLLAARQAEAEFRAEIKVMIAHQGETFQTLRSDINKAVGEAGLNVERLRTEMHKESSVNLRWIVSTMIALGLATAGAVSWVVKSGMEGRSATTATALVTKSVADGTTHTETTTQAAPRPNQ
ncbi:hypothetical protein [Curvibacter lanceolatus]|uniref:hypothetical protein n=1 Tax=Curvibacter lanceolatus TaxID=86182 RepID=UPI0003A912CB|nr:hypothetical protein [Curvibacter lanceolatus]